MMGERSSAMRTVVVVGVVGGVSGLAAGQSLFQQAPPPAPPAAPGAAAAAASAGLEGFSLIAVKPPEPREFRVHDLVTIIVNQSSKMTHDQSLDTEKKTTNSVSVESFLDLKQLLTELQWVDDVDETLDLIDLDTEQKFEGDGEFEREDRVTARLTAEVVDVKPNGTLVLEARTTMVTDKEEQTMLLSGVCRAEDVTEQNTIQSTQLSDLRLETRHSGDVRDASKKGIITRALEAIFNF